MNRTHAELVDIARGWLFRSPKMPVFDADRRAGCPIVLTEIVTDMRETPDAIGWYYAKTYLVECKTGRADFHADRRKSFRKQPEHGAGDFRYYMTPENLVTAEEVPEHWGLLWARPRGGVTVVKHAGRQPCSREAEAVFLLSTIRRLPALANHSVAIRVYTTETKRTATLSTREPSPVECWHEQCMAALRTEHATLKRTGHPERALGTTRAMMIMQELLNQEDPDAETGD